MTKRKDNEPDDKALERLKQFNRQRQAIPGENPEPDSKKGQEKEDPASENEIPDANPPARKKIKSPKKSPKK